MLVIGSHALVKNNININREMPDIDIVASMNDIERYIKEKKKLKQNSKSAYYPTNSGNNYFVLFDNQITEFEVAWPNTLSHELIDLAKQDKNTIYENNVMYASLDLCYTLKMSHRYKKNSVHFNKTMNDIHLLRIFGAKIREEWRDWYKRREKNTYSYNHPKLNTNKDSFFKDDIYTYDHDTIHESVKHLDKPAYEYYKSNNEEVMCDKSLWDSCNEEIKLFGVLEESYVLALERSQIPYPSTPRIESFKIALMKVCTSITSGWFREYAWENYNKIMQMYNENYVDKFNNALLDGKILPFTGNKY